MPIQDRVDSIASSAKTPNPTQPAPDYSSIADLPTVAEMVTARDEIPTAFSPPTSSQSITPTTVVQTAWTLTPSPTTERTSSGAYGLLKATLAWVAVPMIMLLVCTT